ncbi:MAG: ABC-2 transporter permease [Actinobacteria bacterium]|nr:ABC-2 transporter permease [Actinomycetota bacterium]
MLRLSLKDLKINKTAFLINLAFWTILGPAWLSLNIDLYLMLPVFFGLFVVMIPMSTELRDNIDILYNSLPIKKRTIIISRYVSSLAMIILIYAWIILIGFLMDKYLPIIQVGLAEKISAGAILLVILPIVLIVCIYVPIVLRFGFTVFITAGVIISMGVFSGFIAGISYIISASSTVTGYQGPGGLAGIIGMIRNNDLVYYLGKAIEGYGTWIPIVLILFVIVLAVFVSINISISIYKRKEF